MKTRNKSKWLDIFLTSSPEEIAIKFNERSRAMVSLLYITYKEDDLVGSKVKEAKEIYAKGELRAQVSKLLLEKSLKCSDTIYRGLQEITISCGCGHKWEMLVKSFLKTKGCRVCLGQRNSKEELEEALHLAISSEDKYKFVGWLKEDSFGKNRRVVIECQEHGKFIPTYHNIVDIGSRCPQCAKQGFNPLFPSFLYVLKVYKGSKGFVGFGITRKFKTRLEQHKCNLKKLGFTIKSSNVWEVSGKAALDIENEILKTFPKSAQKVEGFKREATALRYHKAVIKLIEDSVKANNS